MRSSAGWCPKNRCYTYPAKNPTKEINMLNGLDYLLAALAAVAAGAVNAIAGGGTLVTFPMLTF